MNISELKKKSSVELEFEVVDRGLPISFRIIARRSGRDSCEFLCEESSKTDLIGEKVWEKKDIGCLIEYLRLNGHVLEHDRIVRKISQNQARSQGKRPLR